MVPTDEGIGASWAEVIVGFSFALVTGAITWLFRADGVNAMRTEELVNEARKAAEADDQHRQEDIGRLDTRFQTHRGEVLSAMVTKGDLAAMEHRIMNAIRDRSAVRGPG